MSKGALMDEYRHRGYGDIPIWLGEKRARSRGFARASFSAKVWCASEPLGSPEAERIRNADTEQQPA